MVNQHGQVVRLSTDNWVKIGLFLAGQAVFVMSVGVALWTRQAVLETKFEALEKAVGSTLSAIDNRLEKESRAGK